jgi:DNA-directed RNA polymerase specialized sigma24 family protein
VTSSLSLKTLSQHSPADLESLAHDPFICKVIHRSVRGLLRRPEFAEDTAEDLTQELLGRVSEAMTQHRSEIGHRNPFVIAIVDRYIANLVEHRSAAVRRTDRAVSINQLIRDGESGAIEMMQTIGQEDHERRLQSRRISQSNSSDLKHDLAIVLAQFTEQEQEFMRLLGDHSVAEASRIMGVPRTTLLSWRKRIARKFDDEGLRDYLA